ncbi:MAG: site-specific integrase, partial [Thermoanaerobaculia bacterium]
MAKAEEGGKEPPAAIAAIRLLILTGCRLGEILGLRWDQVDFERQLLRFQESKTGQKAVPLGAAALELLSELSRDEGNPHVIPGKKPGSHFVGMAKVWQRIRKQAQLEDVRLHDLRHSFASVGAGAGLSLPIIGKLLGHTQAATIQRYAHLGALL